MLAAVKRPRNQPLSLREGVKDDSEVLPVVEDGVLARSHLGNTLTTEQLSDRDP